MNCPVTKQSNFNESLGELDKGSPDTICIIAGPTPDDSIHLSPNMEDTGLDSNFNSELKPIQDSEEMLDYEISPISKDLPEVNGTSKENDREKLIMSQA